MSDDQQPEQLTGRTPRALRSPVLGAAILLLAGVLLGWIIFPGADYAMNVWTQALGTGATLGLFVLINRWQVQRQYHRQLIDEVASLSADTARNAVHQMSRHGLLQGDSGLLRGARLERANLREAYLRDANLHGAALLQASLREADLTGATLSNANLIKANLQGADFTGADLRDALLQNTDAQSTVFFRADLERANLFGAKLTNANLREANLQDAVLTDADLHGANMAAANLQGAKLKADCFDTETWLPDGRYWTPATDLGRYSDPAHPQFWRSPDEKSPAAAGGADVWRTRRTH